MKKAKRYNAGRYDHHIQYAGKVEKIAPGRNEEAKRNWNNVNCGCSGVKIESDHFSKDSTV